jgi:hypothetical protein
MINKYMQDASMRSSSRSPFRNVSQEQYDIVNNTNESSKRTEKRSEKVDSNMLTEATRGMAITKEGFKENQKKRRASKSKSKNRQKKGAKEESKR